MWRCIYKIHQHKNTHMLTKVFLFVCVCFISVAALCFFFVGFSVKGSKVFLDKDKADYIQLLEYIYVYISIYILVPFRSFFFF